VNSTMTSEDMGLMFGLDAPTWATGAGR